MTTWPEDPEGSMEPILEASVAAAAARHPSASGPTPGVLLGGADRCDRCGAAAGYRMGHQVACTAELQLCVHHWRKHFPSMFAEGWVVIGGNPDVLSAHQED